MNNNNIRILINEEVRKHFIKESLEKELGNIIVDFSKDLENIKKEEDLKNEAGVVLTASIVLAAPVIIRFLSNLGKKGAEIINKKLEKESKIITGSEEWFKELSEVAEKLHHLYLKPIEYAVKNVFKIKDEQKVKKISNLLFHVIIAVLLYFSGVGAVKAFEAKNINLGFLESILAAIKSNELKGFIVKTLSKI
jgi:hypothetical protein